MEKENLHKGHRIRLRETFRKNGLQNMEDHQILELMLFYAIPQKDTNEIAHRLLNRFGSLSEVFDADFEDLCLVDGISEGAATFIMMIAPLLKVYQKDKAKNNTTYGTFEKCCAIITAEFIGDKKEKVVVVTFDDKCRIINIDTVCEGNLDSAVFSIRNVVDIAIKQKAKGIVLAHNHPSGIAIPSEKDIETTKNLIKKLRELDISMLDHIIVANGDYVSMAQSSKLRKIF